MGLFDTLAAKGAIKAAQERGLTPEQYAEEVRSGRAGVGGDFARVLAEKAGSRSLEEHIRIVAQREADKKRGFTGFLHENSIIPLAAGGLMAGAAIGGLSSLGSASGGAAGSASGGATAAGAGEGALGSGLKVGAGSSFAPGMGTSLGSGLTAGTTAAGIGGGALGTGIGTGIGGAAGLAGAGAAGLGALGAGYFASESLPALGAASGGGTAAAGAASGAAKSTALGRILKGEGGLEDYLALGGALAPSLIGAYASGQQADAINALAGQSRADRAPFLGAANAWLASPDAYLAGPGKASLDAVLRGLSAKHGNPIGSPTAMGIATEAGLRDWRDAVTGMANIGLSGEDTRANLGLAGIKADANVYNALGAGMADVLNPPKGLEDLLKGLKSLPSLV